MTTFTDARTVTDTVVTTGSSGSITAVDVNGAINAAIDAAEDELAAVVATKGVANGLASLDSGGKVPSAQLPAIAITEVHTVASEVAMLALSAERGDVAIRSDLNKSFVLSTDSPSTLADWKELLTPTDAVLSVAGKTGAVVLVANDISDAGTAGKAVLAGATAAAIRASGILNIDSVRSNIGDAAATLAATDRVVVTTAALTTARAWTLPAANAVNAGQSLLILDLFGGVTSTNKITVTRAGSDTINGATTFDVTASYGGVILISDGSSKWSAQAVGTQAQTATNLNTEVIFTAGGTFSKASYPGLQGVIVEVWGAGGGGGGSGTTDDRVGGGGGAGGYARKFIDAASLGTSETVTIGTGGTGGAAGNNNGTAGGNSSFGSHCTGNGGAAGTYGSSGGGVSAGGTGSGGDINITGQYGQRPAAGSHPGASGVGPNAVMGVGGGGIGSVNGGAVGTHATGYGSGGGGGERTAGGGNAAGSNGAGGLVVVHLLR